MYRRESGIQGTSSEACYLLLVLALYSCSVYVKTLCLLPYVCLLKRGCAEFTFWLLVNFILFPGGGCKICGSVEHFRRDCPELLQQNKGRKYIANTNTVVLLVIINLIPFDVRSPVEFLCQTQAGTCVYMYTSRLVCSVKCNQT